MRCYKCGLVVPGTLEYSFEIVIADHEDEDSTLLVPCYHKMATTIFNKTPAEYMLLAEDERDALKEPWYHRPVLARAALERQENDEVRVTLFDVRKLPTSYIAPK